MSVLFPPYLCVCVSSQRRYRCTYIDSLFVCWCVCVCVWESWWVCFTVPDIFFVCVFSYVLYICVVFGPHAGRGLAVLPLFIWHFLINEVCPPSSSSSSSSSSSFSCTPLTLSVPPPPADPRSSSPSSWASLNKICFDLFFPLFRHPSSLFYSVLFFPPLPPLLLSASLLSALSFFQFVPFPLVSPAAVLTSPFLFNHTWLSARKAGVCTIWPLVEIHSQDGCGGEMSSRWARHLISCWSQ